MHNSGWSQEIFSAEVLTAPIFSDDSFGLNKNQIDRPGLAKTRLFL